MLKNEKSLCVLKLVHPVWYRFPLRALTGYADASLDYIPATRLSSIGKKTWNQRDVWPMVFMVRMPMLSREIKVP
jgi:hypothetical protein